MADVNTFNQNDSRPVIEMNNIEKEYGEAVKTQILFDVNLSFKEGTFNSIIGESGSGKTTILNIMGTLDRPSRGEIIIDGVRTDSMNNKQLAELRNQKLGFIFQFHYLLPEFTALENVLMPYLISHKTVPAEIKRRADNIMYLVGIEKVKNNPAGRMSGGQQQRTAIARALINSPRIILADEPTGNLDSESTENVYSILRDINEKEKTTFVVITHDRRIAEKADRIVEIKDGRIYLDILR